MEAMISRRKYASMTIMMLVLLFMFQSTMVVKDLGNRYNENEYATPSAADRSSSWSENSSGADSPLAEFTAEESYVAYIGNTEENMGDIVKEWCTYTKRDLQTYDPGEGFDALILNSPEILVVDPAYVDFERDAEGFLTLADAGVNMIFCALPAPEVIESNPDIQELFGIKSVEAESVELKGIKLFGGFLLGGEVIYEVKTEADRKRQDLTLDVPWYIVFGNTKTYMVGMLEDESIENEHLPSIVWRNSCRQSKVFCVNGDYMYDDIGLGFLDAMMYELHEYELYPIINSQSLIISNFPGFAEENEEEMQRIYSRTPASFYRDIMWPSITGTTRQNNMQETLYFMAQGDYSDGNEPKDTDYVFFLKEAKEQEAEAGISMSIKSGDIPLRDKLTADMNFYDSTEVGYAFTSAYVDSYEQAKEAAGMIGEFASLSNFKTFVMKAEDGVPVVSYISENVTLQSTTSDGFDYTYFQDIRMRSLQTSLGYTNILLDMYRMTFPETKRDVWEIRADDFTRNINTFWRPFEAFEYTTVSESDRRVRCFLNLDYAHMCENNRITLRTTGATGEYYFILRTRNQEIKSLTGGEYVEVEEDAYILYLREDEVVIELSDTLAPFYQLAD